MTLRKFREDFDETRLSLLCQRNLKQTILYSLRAIKTSPLKRASSISCHSHMYDFREKNTTIGDVLSVSYQNLSIDFEKRIFILEISHASCDNLEMFVNETEISLV